MIKSTRQRRRRHRTGWTIAGLTAACLLADTGAVASASSAALASYVPAAAAPDLPTPLATSLQSSGGTWATLPMGHLEQPSDTFWQLLFRPAGSTSWSNHVEATATATNGGLVLASGRGRALIVGILPSNYLHFAPMISTTNAGESWSNGLLASGLAARPDALAAGPSGETLALAGGSGDQQVLASNDLSNWRTITSRRALSSSKAGKSCGVASITAVGALGNRVLIGGSCSRSGVVGLFTQGSGSWQLGGPTLPPALTRGQVEVLGIETTGQGVSVLLAIADHGATSLVAVSGDGGGMWQSSAALRIASSEHVSSFGPANGAGLFVLLATDSGEKHLVVADDPSRVWRELPAPPAQTATVAFGEASVVDALAVNNTVLTVWHLRKASKVWARGQVLHVSILFGSSA